MYKAMKAAAMLAVVLMTAVCVASTLTDGADAATAWDGTTTDITWYDDLSDSFEISTATQLAGLAEKVNQGEDFSGKTITLSAEIDLCAKAWTPIGTLDNPFSGKFDGADKTISNLSISQKDGVTYHGLFGYVSGAEISNVSLSGVSVNVSGDDIYIGSVVGYATLGASINGCTVSGTVVGTSADTTEEAPTATGGVVGAAVNGTSDTPVTITGCINNATVSGLKITGGIVGLSTADISRCNNTGTVTISHYNSSVGGIVGEQRLYGTISGCENTGAVTAQDLKSGVYSSAGGIVGWVRYSSFESSPVESSLLETVSLIDCRNSASVSANASMSGGIIGSAYHSVTVTDCENTGAVKGTNFVSGIIGGAQTITDASTETHNLGDDGCRITIVDCSSTGTITGTGTNVAVICGHIPADDAGRDLNHDSYLTIYGNSGSSGSDTSLGLYQFVSGGAASVATISFDGIEYGYPTLAEAVTAVPTDGARTTITLMEDIALPSKVTIQDGQNIVLNMNGKAITPVSGFSGRSIENHGTLTITGEGTFDSSAEEAALYGPLDNYGTLVIENGTFKGNLASNSALIWNRTGGTATFNGGTYEGAGTTISTQTDTVTTINGGDYSTPWYPALENRGYALVTGGTFTNTSCSGCDSHWGYTIRNGYEAVGAHLVIKPVDDSNVKVTGTQGGVSAVSGIVEIYGGIFKTQKCEQNHNAAFYALYVAGETGEVETTVYGGVFESCNRSAVQIGNSGDGGSKLPAKVTIEGGSFSISDSSSTADLITVDEKTDSTAMIEGGDFQKPVDDKYVVPGSGMFQRADGRWGVYESWNVTFEYGDGKTETVEVRKGFPVASDKVPAPSDGQQYTWKSNGEEIDPYTHEFTADATLVADPTPVDAEFTVTFMDEDNLIEAVRTTDGTITPPVDPEKTGLIFVGWMNGDVKADFTNITDDMTVTASWELTVPEVKIEQNLKNPTQGDDVILTAVVSNDGSENGVTYTYSWNEEVRDKTLIVTSDGTYTVVVTASYGGKTASSNEASIMVTFQEPEPEPSTVSVTVSVDQVDAVIAISGYTGTVQSGVPIQLSSGTYTVTVTKEGFETYTKIITVSDGPVTLDVELVPSESDTPVSPPSGDDDESLPPIIRPGTPSSSGDDDTVTIVACAAAAAVAAILAVFLIYAYRKD